MSDKYPGGFVTANAPAGFSVAFDGTGDYLTAASSSNLTLGTGDFTIEAWIYPINWTNSSASVVRGNGVVNSPAFAKVDATAFFGIANEGVAWIISDAALPTVNSWSHVAVTRSGTTVKIFINGVQSGSTATSSVNFTNPIRTIGTNSGSDAFFTGYISNVRVLKGTALYTTTFTPPTQMFPVTNTQLLACQSPTIIDNSTNALAITVSGDAKVSNFTPFAAYQGFNPALGAAAGGVWTLDEAAYYQQNRLWPIYDPYFNQTTLMLHGNGTNAAQNNTFLDSSTNNFTITRNGNTTQGTFTPFSQTGWSTYFVRANTDYLGLPNGSLALGSNDFSLEAWVYPLDRSNGYSFLAGNTDRATAGGSSFTLSLTNSNGYFESTFWFGGSATNLYSPSVPINTWTHLAVCRTGNTLGMFVNGVSVATASCSGSINAGSSTYNPSIGSNGTGSADNWNGYISNVRVIIGSGGYTPNQNFTPSTAPLTVTTNTKLLATQSNRYVDNSANNYTITPGGSPSTQAFSPFVPAYITPTTYSNWFDGSGDYLQIASATALQLNTSVAWTIEAWVYPTTLSGDNGIIAKRSGGSTEWQFSHSSSSGLTLYTGATTYFSGQTLTVNKFQHVAITWDLTTLRFFIDGVQTPTTNTGISLPASNTYPVNIASNTAGGETWYGCISNLRLVKGTALYTASFTPPTAPLTNITNTSLLTCQSSTFIDNSSNAFTITAAGNTLPVTSPTPFPAKVDQTTLNSAYSTSLIGGSAYFDGTGDYLSLAQQTALNFGTGNFTLEAWVYPTTTLGDATCIFTSVSSGGLMFGTNGAAGSGVWALGRRGVSWDNSSSAIPVLNQWQHVAVCRSGTSVKIFVNGVQSGSTFTNSTSYDLSLGGTIIGYQVSYMNGYFCGVRATNSALYTSNFAPPITPPTPVTNTQLLLNYTNGAIFDSTAKNVLETAGNAQISTAQSKFGGSSMYFDGTGDYLKIPTTGLLEPRVGDFTWEAWIYHTTSASGTMNYFAQTNGGLAVNRVSSGKLQVDIYNVAGVMTGATTIPINQWVHIAVCRRGANWYGFLNGVVDCTASATNNITGSGDAIGVGATSTGVGPFTGYIDDMRFTKGVARYITNFTPPTSQLQDQ